LIMVTVNLRSAPMASRMMEIMIFKSSARPPASRGQPGRT
jgi:hypothetical protein